MRTMLRVALMLAILVPTLGAQGAEHEAAYGVVTRLFDAMRARDTASMRSAFAPGALMQSMGAQGLRADPVDAWILSVARAPQGTVLDERLANPIVQVRGELATVWVDYWFYVGDRFSHCGVDAFTLAKSGDRWRVISVADTRQREGCPAYPTR